MKNEKQREWNYVRVPWILLMILANLASRYILMMCMEPTGIMGGNTVKVFHDPSLYVDDSMDVISHGFSGIAVAFILLGVVISALVLVCCIKIIPKENSFIALRTALSFILGGAICNVLNVLFYSNPFRIEFFNSITFRMFTLGDLFLFIGIIATIILLLTKYRKAKLSQHFKKTKN